MASYLWARLTWSRALFGLLVLNLIWTASLFIAPMILKPGTFAWPYTQYPVVAYHLGGANQLDYEPIWQTLSLYARAVYTFGDIQCHELWYRSFWINGNQMPIDARMTSMYIFANVGLVAAAFAVRSTSAAQVMLNAMPRFLRKRLSRLKPERAGTIIVVAGLLPLAVDGFYQLFSNFTHYESTNMVRVLTGVPSGFVGGLLIGAMLVSIRQFSVDIREMRARLT